MKILFVAPVHPWDDVRVFQKQASSAAKAGMQVSVIAKSETEIVHNSVEIIPAEVTYSSRTKRFLSIPRLARQVLKEDADIYHLHNPDTIPIALMLKLFGKTVIYDTHEDFSERLIARDWIPFKLRKLVAYTVNRAEIFTAKICDASIATQEDVVKRLGDKCTFIGNPPRVDENLLMNIKEIASLIPQPAQKTFRLVYIGSIGETRGIYEMIDSLVEINNTIDCRLWLIGSISENLLNSIKLKEGWKFVDFIERIPQEQALAYVYLSDIGLIYINDVADHRKSDANKLYEYMSLGLPFIASDFPLWKNKLNWIGAGLFITPGSANLLTEAVLEIYKKSEKERLEMGQRGKEYTMSHSWEKEFSKLLNVYNTIGKKL